MDIMRAGSCSLSSSLGEPQNSKSQDKHAGSQDFENIDATENHPEIANIKDIEIPISPFLNRLSPTARREETYFEKFQNMGMNLKFSLDGFGQNHWLVEGDKDFSVYLMGEKFEIGSNRLDKAQKLKEIKDRFSKITWFSYRKNFPKLNHKKLPLAESFISDTGWGCMIRACQMMFAECLKRCYHSQQLRNSENNSKNSEELSYRKLNYRIISWFLDSEVNSKNAPYSIQTISKYIYSKFKTLPGIWLKPSMVLFALQKMHKEFSKYTLPDLDVEIFLEGTIYLTQTIKKMTSVRMNDDENSYYDSGPDSDFEVIEEDDHGNKMPSQKHKKRNSKILSDVKLRKSSSEGHPFESSLVEDHKDFEKLFKMKWKKSLVIYLLAKIGLDKPNPEYMPFMKELLSYPESIGMIGGRPGLAYYIVGYSKDRLIYLDPHFVQESVKNKRELEKNLESYSYDKIKSIGYGDIDTSVAFGFFIQDETSFQEFVARFQLSCEKKDSFLGLEMSVYKEEIGDVESFDDGDDEDEFEMVFVK